MEKKVDINSVYVPSEDIVAREIEGEVVIIPISSGIGDMEDALYTLNQTGRAIWEGLDGKKSLEEIIRDLAASFQAPAGVIREDVLGLVEELLKRRMVTKLPEK